MPHAPGTHWLGNILQILLAHIVEEKVDLTRICRWASSDEPRTPLPIDYSLQSCCDVDAVTEYIVVVDDDIADMDAYSKFNSEFLPDIGVLLDHSAGLAAAHRINSACEFDQHTVASRLDNAAAVVCDSRIYKRSWSAFNCASVCSSLAPIKRL